MRPGQDAAAPGCEHVAVVHRNVDDLSRRLGPSLHRAAEESGAVLLCLEEPAAARVRADFGSVCDSFEFIPATTRYSTPGVAMSALHRFVDDAIAAGAPAAWSIGAIPLADDGRDVRWVRYETAVLALFADRPLRAVCLYDAHATPVAIRHGVLGSHQSVDGDWSGSGDGAELQPTIPDRNPDLVLTGLQPRDVRVAVRRSFENAVSSESLADLLLVASELVTNAIRHGAPPIEVLAWQERDYCVLQVRDTGRATIDDYADLRPCTGGAHGGFGLFTVGQIADGVDIHRHADGNRVSVHLSGRR